MPIAEKRCHRCGNVKPANAFSRARQSKDGYHTECKACQSERYFENKAAQTPEERAALRVRRADNAQRMRASDPAAQALRHIRQRLERYDLTMGDFVALWTAQDGKCGVCPAPLDGNLRIVIDHDHETQEVRGLLCVCCNTILGQARDDVAVLEAAIAYLRQHKGG